MAAFVEGAHQGVVLAAFGTVYGPTLRPEDVHALAKGFAALEPVRVLWVLKPAAVPPGVDLKELPFGGNTLVVPWVDYNVSCVHCRADMRVTKLLCMCVHWALSAAAAGRCPVSTRGGHLCGVP